MSVAPFDPGATSVIQRDRRVQYERTVPSVSESHVHRLDGSAAVALRDDPDAASERTVPADD